MNEPTDIISRMEAMQQRFGRLQLCDTPPESGNREIICYGWDGRSNPMYCYRDELNLSEHQRTYVSPNQFKVDNDLRPESERQILRCAPPFDAQAEHEADLRYESRVDYESWQYDGPEEMEDA